MNQEVSFTSRNWNDKTCKPMIDLLPHMEVSRLLFIARATLAILEMSKKLRKKSRKKLHNNQKKLLRPFLLYQKPVPHNTVSMSTASVIVNQEPWNCREPVAAWDCRDPIITWEPWTCRTRSVWWKNQEVTEMNLIVKENIVLITAVLVAPTIIFVAWQRWQNTMPCPLYALILTDTVIGDSEVCSTRGRPSELQNQRLGKF